MRLVLVLSGLLAGLLLAEAGSRVLERVQCRDNPGAFWEPDRFLGWRHTPGARGWAQRCLRGRPEWRVHARINRLGLRGRDTPHARGRRFRILLLGDSFAEGLQVEEEETVARLLERRLGADFEVLNGGVSGYGTDNELLFYEREGWRYRPDLVLLAFNTSNDVLENDYDLMRGTGFPYPEKPHFELEAGRLVRREFPLAEEPPVRRVLGRLGRWLARHSALYRLLPAVHLPRLPGEAGAAPGAAPLPRGTLPIDVYRADYPEQWRVAWRITRGLILRLRQAVEAHGSRLGVVVVNGREEVAERRWQWTLFVDPALRAQRWEVDKPNRLITSFLARRALPTVALLDVFREHWRATGVSGFFEWDVHWAPTGHALAAETIGRALHGLGLVGEARPAEAAP